MTYDERKLQNEKIKGWAYYILIAVVSIVATAFLPLVGTEMGLGWEWPNTWFGWMIWATTRVGIAIVNVLIFYCFIAQGKVNVKNDPAYIEANELLKKHNKSHELKPRSPKHYFAHVWTLKGGTIFVSSAVSTVVLTEALLKFDVMNFLTYLFTVIMGLIFGYLEMRKTEEYWVTEYPEWAKEIIKKESEKSEEPIKED